MRVKPHSLPRKKKPGTCRMDRASRAFTALDAARLIRETPRPRKNAAWSAPVPGLLAPPPLRLPNHVCQPPRLDRMQLTTAFSAAKSLRELIEREPHRDFGKPAHWPESFYPAARAEALDVRVAVSGKLLDGGVGPLS